MPHLMMVCFHIVILGRSWSLQPVGSCSGSFIILQMLHISTWFIRTFMVSDACLPCVSNIFHDLTIIYFHFIQFVYLINQFTYFLHSS